MGPNRNGTGGRADPGPSADMYGRIHDGTGRAVGRPPAPGPATHEKMLAYAAHVQPKHDNTSIDDATRGPFMLSQGFFMSRRMHRIHRTHRIHRPLLGKRTFCYDLL